MYISYYQKTSFAKSIHAHPGPTAKLPRSVYEAVCHSKTGRGKYPLPVYDVPSKNKVWLKAQLSDEQARAIIRAFLRDKNEIFPLFFA